MRAHALPRPRALSLGVLLAALLIGGCASRGGSGSAITVSGKRLTIYASPPPGGAGGQVAADVVRAESLALPGPVTIGGFTVSLKTLNGAKVSDNARTADEDRSSIAYIGEIVPGTSGVSLQITNELDLLQVSPLDTAVYLTQSTPAVPGAPGSFYPSGSSYHQTFARVTPTTLQEAKAIVSQMQTLRLSKVYVTDDGSTYGAALADQLRRDVPGGGMSVVSAPSAADVIFYAGNSAAAATTAVDKLADQSPAAKLFVPSALYDDAFVAKLSAPAQRNLYVSSPGFTSSDLPAAAQQFQSSFESKYGHAPAPQAVFGYEAVSAVLAVLREAGAKANDRATVVRDFESIKDRQSVLGTYSIHNGDTSIAPIIIARVRNGALVPVTGSG